MRGFYYRGNLARGLKSNTSKTDVVCTHAACSIRRGLNEMQIMSGITLIL